MNEYSDIHQVTLNRISEKLIGGHDEGAEDEEGGRVSVEQAECPVIYGRLLISNLISSC